MKKIGILILLWLTAGGFLVPAQAKELVREFNGTRSGHTAAFEVEAPWLLDWRLRGDFPGMLAIDVSLVEANTGAHMGGVLKSKYVSDGVRLFNQGGRFQFKVDSTLARWTLKVEQLTEEEAELYTPKR
jgi:hypothetical protein